MRNTLDQGVVGCVVGDCNCLDAANGVFAVAGAAPAAAGLDSGKKKRRLEDGGGKNLFRHCQKH